MLEHSAREARHGIGFFRVSRELRSALFEEKVGQDRAGIELGLALNSKATFVGR